MVACGPTEVVPFPVVALPNHQRDGPWNPMSRKKMRDMGHPRVVVASADSRFLTGLSARFGMTRVSCGLATGRVVSARTSTGLKPGSFWVLDAALKRALPRGGMGS